ncbi:VOC family protein [Caldalkalibacillus salinus]|uniref:VOC family protein n=1 Tax=Caldalkalibacillus salinus TaxID=2803787 RepID=UPI001922269E|nr:VOC family protein [Caldalkalibacillus salinus]
MSQFHQAPHTFVSDVTVNVEDIERSLSFYQGLIGFKVLQQADREVRLSADGQTPLLTLKQPTDVEPKKPRTTGLYHMAMLLPQRSDLAQVLHHLIDHRYPIEGGSDHLVSEALYLSDPDGNGIELYVDRSPDTWEWDGNRVKMTVDPLNEEQLLAETQGELWSGLPAGTRMGHIHLHVSQLDEAESFYVHGLGFQIVSEFKHALFLSTGGYHHHIAVNTWAGVGAPKPAENSVGLHSFTIRYKSEESRDQVLTQLDEIEAPIKQTAEGYLTEDPAGNRIVLKVV